MFSCFVTFRLIILLKFVSTADPTLQNASTAPRRGTDNNSRASKAQGDASSRENGREGVQTDSGFVRGGLCFFIFFGNFSVFLDFFFRDNRKL